MEILEFVKIDEVDPLYFDASYYAAPEEAGARAYHLLLEAMKKSGYAGIAKVTMHSRENIVIIRASGNGLTLHTMFYSNEIRPAAEYGNIDKTELKDQERTMAVQLIENLAAPFRPEKYHDTYQEGLRTLIAAKAEGQDVVAPPHISQPPAIDLMAALKRSLSETKKPAEEKKSLLRVVPKTGEKTGEAVAKKEESAKKSRRKAG
jgi:DNA end-binding protein Ku